MSTLDLLGTEAEIKSLLIRERYYRDSGQWQKLRDAYHPDASRTSLNISWFSGDIDGFVEGSKKALAGGTVSSHTIQPVEVDIDGDKALATSTGSVNVRVVIDGCEYEAVSLVRFVTQLGLVQVRSAPEWRLLTLEAIYDRDYIIPTNPISGHAPKLVLPAGARPSYKYLDYVLTKQGFSIARDLPGTDDADSVAKLIGEATNWLHSK